MKIALTGSNGFVGQNLGPFFAQHNFEIIPLKVRASNIETLDISTLGLDAIVHLAGIAHDLKGLNADEAYQKSNTDLSIQLIQKFLDTDIPDFIFISSVKARADTAEQVLTEAVQATPTTPYGVSKLKVETYINSLSLPAGKRIFILQPTLIYGAGSKGNLSLLLNFVRRRLPYPFGAFYNKRSFLNVKNLGFVITQLLQKKEIQSDIFLLADDEAKSTNQLINDIASVMGLKASIIKVPKFIINPIVKIGDVLNLPLNSAMVAKLTENFCVDNSKVKKVLGIDKMPFDMHTGLKDMIDTLPKKQ